MVRYNWGMKYFLAKADPDHDYGIEDLKRDGTTNWDGVHNFQAINAIKAMRPGDRVLIYHSQTQKAIVGEAEVIGEPFENENDPRTSWAVKLRYVRTFDHPVTLAEVKNEPSVSDFLLVTHSRLSVMPVPDHVVAWLKPRLGL